MKKICLACIIIVLASCKTTIGPAAKPAQEAAKFVKFENLPEIGVTRAGQHISLGGFSGLFFLEKKGDGTHRFLTLTDRGANAESEEDRRPFLIPNFAPEMVVFELNPATGELKITERIPLKDSHGKHLTGLPKAIGMEEPYDVMGKRLHYDPNGVDSEGICVDGENQIWIGEEYGPSLCAFDWKGLQKVCLSPGKGLPEIYAKRKHNRGFEGVACKGNRVYAFLQSPLPHEKLNGRFVEIDSKTKKFLAEYIYPFENKEADKIGDATVLPNGSLAVLERDHLTDGTAFKKIYKIELPTKAGEPVKKTLVHDLVTAGLKDMEKTEGFAVTSDYVFVISDNDFGIMGKPDKKTGLVQYNKVPSMLFYFKTK